MYTIPTSNRIKSRLFSLFVGACLGLSAFTAHAISTTIVISQVYGGGGNSGANYKNDFIELHNISSAAVSIGGWSVQYSSATNTGTWTGVTNLSGNIQPGAYYLVQETAGTGGTLSLPAPDATGSINLSGTTGKVALVTTTAALTGAVSSGPTVVDMVGFGTANAYEGTGPAPTLSNTTAALRDNNGSTDTDNNASDFAAGGPAPRNSATTPFLPGPTSANPTAVATASPAAVPPGQSVTLTVTVTPGTNPTSTGLSVTGDLSAIGGSSTQIFSGSGNVFTYNVTLPSNLSFGSKLLSFSVMDAQARTVTATLSLPIRGNVTIFHTNDTHARVTPHKWIIPQHSGNPQTHFEDVGGVAYVGAKVLSLAAAQPDALVLDGGDISEGNPIGDWNGPPSPVGVFGNGTIVEYFKLLDTKLRAIPGRAGRGLDAMVVGNHDIRNITYLNNMKAASLANFPILSINICNKGTHTPYYQAYTIVNINGNKVGIVGYTTESSDSSDPAVTAAIDVVKCDWSSTDATKIHFADFVNDLRNNQGCTLVILLTHMGHSGLCTVTTANPTPILVDNAVAQLPEVVISGHWHTFCDTVWQPTSLNYKTIFTEAGSFTHYVSELRVNGVGKYISNANYPIRDTDLTPDADIATLIQNQKEAYAATSPTYGVDQVLGYTSDDLLLDNYMKWWSADEYPWSGDNTAGSWICDAVQWKATSLFGRCDLSIEDGGGVRSDIPAGPVTYSQIYETFPWADDTIYMVKMTGAEIWNYFKQHGCDAAMSHGWFVTAYDGIPTSITYNGQPIDLAHSYDVAINNYMYTHDSVPFTDQNPQTSTYLARTALMDYTSTFTRSAPYTAGGPRYSLNTDFSGGYRAVVTMMNDADSKTAFDDAFIRFLSATPETLQHRGTKQVPTTLVNADGSVIQTNRLAENELYRSYLGFKSGVLHPGDIIETWGKGSFYQGDPEFVDQEGISGDGVEFKIVGHDDSLAKPAFMPSIASFWDAWHKNHYVKFLAKKTGPSSVADQTGQTLQIMDVTAYAAKTLPGNVGDLLLITGIPTMESFSLRFRADTAVLAATAGITSFPPVSTVSSHVDPVPASVTGGPLALTATATVNANNTWVLTPVADAQVASGNASTNYGTSTNLFLQSSTSGFGNERSWLKFDLSTLPAGSTITSASLQLFCWKATGDALPAEVRGASDDTWTETGLIWSNQPAQGSVLSTQTLAAATTSVWYNWDVTPFVQSEWSGDKTISLVAKPVTEDSATSPSYGFDSKEYGGTTPLLQISTQASGTPVTIAQVQFFYRYASDNASWGSWTSFAAASAAPYAASFSFPQGYGYYEFYSVAIDSLGGLEPTPAAAQSATHYTAAPAYTTAAVVALGNLSQTYNGAARSVTATTVPPGLTIGLTYNGSSTTPVDAGLYAVVATINQAGYSGSATGTLAVAKLNQTITFGALAPKTTADQAFALGGSASSGLGLTYTSGNPSVATVSGATVTLVGPGTTTITADQVGNVNYYSAASVSQPLTVTTAAAPGGGSDIPAMPLWAIGALAATLFAVGTRLLKTRRQA